MDRHTEAGEWLERPTVADARARYGRASSHVLRVAGVDLHVLDERGPAPGPAVVLLSAQWLGVSPGDRWAPLLTGAGRIVRVDLPGQGLSGGFPDGDYSARAYAALLAETVAALDLGAHVVVGTSFSGIAAALYAASRPAELVGLVLATSSGLPRPADGTPPGGPPADPHIAETRDGARPRRFYAWKLSTLLRRPMAERERAALIDEVHLMNELPGRSEEASRRAAQHDPELFGQALPDVTVPLLVQWSSHSTYLPPAMAQRIADLARSVRGVRHYPDTGHLLLQDAPEACARDVQAFLVTL